MLMRSRTSTTASLAAAGALILLASAALPAADPVPTYDVSEVCRPIPEMRIGTEKKDQEVCLRSERDARQELVRKWSSFPSDSKTLCRGLGEHYLPSYVELLVCLEMQQEAKRIRSRDKTSKAGK